MRKKKKRSYFLYYLKADVHSLEKCKHPEDHANMEPAHRRKNYDLVYYKCSVLFSIMYQIYQYWIKFNYQVPIWDVLALADGAAGGVGPGNGFGVGGGGGGGDGGGAAIVPV